MKGAFKSYCAKKASDLCATIYPREQDSMCSRNWNYFLILSNHIVLFFNYIFKYNQNACIAHDKEKDKHFGCKIEGFSSYS